MFTKRNRGADFTEWNAAFEKGPFEGRREFKGEGPFGGRDSGERESRGHDSGEREFGGRGCGEDRFGGRHGGGRDSGEDRFGGRHFGGHGGGHHFGGHGGGHHFGGQDWGRHFGGHGGGHHFGEHPLHALRSRMQEYFRGWEDHIPMDRFRAPVNVYKTENTYEVLVFAPGRKKEYFQVKIKDGQLIVSYAPPADAGRLEWVRKEYSRGGFERSFPLDDTIETDDVQAKYEDGVLQLSLKIKPGSVKPAQEVPVS